MTLFSLCVDGITPKLAIESILNEMALRVQGHGGAIAINRYGEIGHAFTTQRMAWASIKDNTLQFGLNIDENHEEKLLS